MPDKCICDRQNEEETGVIKTSNEVPGSTQARSKEGLDEHGGGRSKRKE